MMDFEVHFVLRFLGEARVRSRPAKFCEKPTGLGAIAAAPGGLSRKVKKDCSKGYQPNTIRATMVVRNEKGVSVKNTSDRPELIAATDAASMVVRSVQERIPGITIDSAKAVVWCYALTDAGFHFSGRRVSVTCLDCECCGSWRHAANAAEFITSGHRGHRTVIGISNPPSSRHNAADTTDLPVGDNVVQLTSGRGEEKTPPALFENTSPDDFEDGTPSVSDVPNPALGAGSVPSSKRSDRKGFDMRFAGLSNLPPGTWDGDPNAPWNEPEIVGVCHFCGEEIPVADEDKCVTRTWWNGGADKVICPTCAGLEIDICEKCGETIELEVSETCTVCGGTGEV